jgi:hypothetical protein
MHKLLVWISEQYLAGISTSHCLISWKAYIFVVLLINLRRETPGTREWFQMSVDVIGEPVTKVT